MRFLTFLAALACATAAHAALPDYRTFPADGDRLLLWAASERGLSPAELEAARKLAAQGVEVWSLDPVNAYLLPPLPSSLEAVPTADVAAWLTAALDSGRQVAAVAVARAAVPLLRAAARLEPAQRGRLCLLLMAPNLYASAEALAAPEYLETGPLEGLRTRVLQPRRSAATPWLPGLVEHLARQGATVSRVMLDDLREGYWARETPTAFEVAEGQRMDALLLREWRQGGCE